MKWEEVKRIMGQRNGEANCTVLNRIICGMSHWENDTSKLEKGREFSKLISKVEHSGWREKLKQNLQSQGGPYHSKNISETCAPGAKWY